MHSLYTVVGQVSAVSTEVRQFPQRITDASINSIIYISYTILSILHYVPTETLSDRSVGFRWVQHMCDVPDFRFRSFQTFTYLTVLLYLPIRFILGHDIQTISNPIGRVVFSIYWFVYLFGLRCGLARIMLSGISYNDIVLKKRKKMLLIVFRITDRMVSQKVFKMINIKSNKSITALILNEEVFRNSRLYISKLIFSVLKIFLSHFKIIIFSK